MRGLCIQKFAGHTSPYAAGHMGSGFNTVRKSNMVVWVVLGTRHPMALACYAVTGHKSCLIWGAVLSPTVHGGEGHLRAWCEPHRL